MAVSVCGMGLIGSFGWFSGPAGGIAGTTLGIASGFLVGGYIIHNHVNKKINVAIQFSDHYAQWRAKAIIEKVYPIFRNFIDSDKEFEDFMCPIAQDICSVPMLAPDGRTYNQKEIYEYISYKTNSDDQNVRSPIRGKDFCKNDLVVDSDYCRRLIEKTEKIYQDVVEYGHESAVEHGMKAVISNTQELMENIRVQVEVGLYLELNEAVRNKKMTKNERDDLIELGTKQWDFRDRIK